VEEENAVQIIIDKLELAGEAGLYFLDRDIMTLRAAGAKEQTN
jgi:ferritin